MATQIASNPENGHAYAAAQNAIRLLRFVPGCCVLYALAAGWPNDSWPWMTLWASFLAYGYFCWTSCFHELAHQTFTGRAWLDTALGRALGTLMFVPYNAYRETHIRHHAYLNRPDDWELWPYSDPKVPRALRFAFVWFDLLLGVFAAPVIYGRIYFHKDSPLRPEVLRTIRFEYLGAVAFWAAFLAVIAWCDAWAGFARAWLIPYYAAGVLQTGRKLTEHLGMASYDPMLGTRTVMGGGPITRLTTYLNFDIFVHGPHHRHPRVPHEDLEGLTARYMERNLGIAFPVYRSYVAAIRAMLPHLFRNPGVGMNAGAAPPARSKRQVQDFVGDVNEEVLAEADRRVCAVAEADS